MEIQASSPQIVEILALYCIASSERSFEINGKICLSGTQPAVRDLLHLVFGGDTHLWPVDCKSVVEDCNPMFNEFCRVGGKILESAKERHIAKWLLCAEACLVLILSDRRNHNEKVANGIFPVICKHMVAHYEEYNPVLIIPTSMSHWGKLLYDGSEKNIKRYYLEGDMTEHWILHILDNQSLLWSFDIKAMKLAEIRRKCGSGSIAEYGTRGVHGNSVDQEDYYYIIPEMGYSFKEAFEKRYKLRLEKFKDWTGNEDLCALTVSFFLDKQNFKVYSEVANNCQQFLARVCGRMKMLDLKPIIPDKLVKRSRKQDRREDLLCLIM